MNKKCLIIQPGAAGDIILCAPIAEYYYELGYDVYWPARKQYRELIERLPHCNYVELNPTNNDPDWLRSDVNDVLRCVVGQFDKILNLADRGPHPTAQLSNENFEQCKYRLAKVDWIIKSALSWSRDRNKEFDLYSKKVGALKKYAFIHNTSSHGETVSVNTALPIVYADSEGCIYDWYGVIRGASEIYCCESAFHQFVDGISRHLDRDVKKFLLPRSAAAKGTRFTISEGWDMSIIGETIIRG